MGNPKGFLKIKRAVMQYRPVCERVMDYRHVFTMRSHKDSEKQASRCMDCGTPSCHWGCPVGNYIPEWNDFVFRGQWQKAFELLNAANNLPEITGRICPAPCEYACVLGINDDPVTIKNNELAIIEYAFEKGFIKAVSLKKRSGKNVAIVGSGPAGLSCAAQLNNAGHRVTVFERDNRIGGILRYGIPDFKLEKWVLNRRIELWQKEGIEFATSVNVGEDCKPGKLLKDFDAVCLAGGSRVPRDIAIEGRNLKGIYFAMDYLTQSNRRVSGEVIPPERIIDAKNKKVVIIGGGDTGADCVGTAHRQGAKCVVQIEVLPKPSEYRTDAYPWPSYPMLLRTSSSHEEGGIREWSVLTKKFVGESGRIRKILCAKAEFSKEAGSVCPVMKEILGSEFEIDADIVILAVGFLHYERGHLIHELGIEFDSRGNLKTSSDYMTSQKGVFSAGDMRRGQSLIVWAISEGRCAAHHIDEYLIGKSSLPDF